MSNSMCEHGFVHEQWDNAPRCPICAEKSDTKDGYGWICPECDGDTVAAIMEIGLNWAAFRDETDPVAEFFDDTAQAEFDEENEDSIDKLLAAFRHAARTKASKPRDAASRGGSPDATGAPSSTTHTEAP
jgi:rubredoxin